MRKTIGIGVLISLLMSAPLQAFAAYSAANAGAYLESKSQSAWTTMGLIALGKTPNLNHLKSIPGGSAIELAAPILAIAASGNDPRTFSSIDLVANLKNKASGGQIGDTASLNDDIFGLLALIAAGEPLISSLVVSQKQYLLSKQNSNGGWGFQPGGSSDTNMTSAAICALIAAGVEKNNDVINRAVDYLKTSQNTDGGFTYDPTSSFGTSSDSSSTAWVLWALTSAGIQNSAITKNGKSGADFLNTTQTGSGYFTYQAGGAEDAFTPTTTAYAIIALSGKTLPLAVYQKPAGPKTEFRIEGKDEIVCQGFVYAVTALDVVKNAKNQCGFSYTIADTAYGPYLKKVNNDEAAGLIGWLYFVNGVSADVGARDYLIKENDSVIWYYGDYTWLPTRIKLDAETLENSQAITGTVEYFEDSSWKTLSGATILAGAKSATTDGSGKFQVSLPAGFYRVFAEKNGYVRSNQGSVRVGTPSSNSVSLAAEVSSGTVLSDTDSVISFTTDTTNLDFGLVGKNSLINKKIKVTNQGTKEFTLTPQASGDPLFSDYLLAEGKNLKQFSSDFSTQQSKDITLSLSIPNTYGGTTGKKSGTLTLWATAK